LIKTLGKFGLGKFTEHHAKDQQFSKSICDHTHKVHRKLDGYSSAIGQSKDGKDKNQSISKELKRFRRNKCLDDWSCYCMKIIGHLKELWSMVAILFLHNNVS